MASVILGSAFSLGLLMLAALTLLSAQREWQKCQSDPLMVGENPPVWKFFTTGQRACLMGDNARKMWYCAASSVPAN